MHASFDPVEKKPVEKNFFLLLGYASHEIISRLFPKPIRDREGRQFKLEKYHRATIASPYDGIHAPTILAPPLFYVPVFHSEPFQTKDGNPCEFSIFKIENKFPYLQYMREKFKEENEGRLISTTLIITINMLEKEYEDSLAAIKKPRQSFEFQQGHKLIPEDCKIIVIGIGDNENRKTDLNNFFAGQEKVEVKFYSSIDQINFDYFKEIADDLGFSCLNIDSKDQSFKPKDETVYSLKLKQVSKQLASKDEKSEKIEEIERLINNAIAKMTYGLISDKKVFDDLFKSVKKQLKTHTFKLFGKMSEEDKAEVSFNRDILNKLKSPFMIESDVDEPSIVPREEKEKRRSVTY